jgi:cell division cycle 14
MIDRDTADAVEIIPDRLYWVSCPGVPKSIMKLHYFSIDMRFIYEPFLADFGPLNLGLTIRYCRMMEALLKDPTLADKRIVQYCSLDPGRRANAAYLVCAYLVIAKRKPAELAFEPFRNFYPPFLPFRDATRGPCTFHMSILDCLRGLETAIQLGWFDWVKFDVEGYEFHQEVENGDMNWIIPDKFLAFAGPCASSTDADGFPAFTPEDYVPVFRSAGIELIVRLNTQQYDRRRFIDNGIKHVDLYFRDGSCPPGDIINKFLHIAESEPEAVAVHCKAGLGRTGTLIGLYAMKHFQFPARAFIAWNRICRPGSILGPQQQFLCDMQQEMFQAGSMLRRPPPPLRGQDMEDRELVQHMQRMSLRGHHQADQYEDVGQGEHLCNSKRGWQGGLGSALGSALGGGPATGVRGAAAPSAALRGAKGGGRPAPPPTRSLKGIFSR